MTRTTTAKIVKCNVCENKILWSTMSIVGRRCDSQEDVRIKQIHINLDDDHIIGNILELDRTMDKRIRASTRGLSIDVLIEENIILKYSTKMDIIFYENIYNIAENTRFYVLDI